MTTAGFAIGTAGGLVLVIALTDIFATVLAYDRFTFIAPHDEQALWRLMRSLATMFRCRFGGPGAHKPQLA